MSLAMTKQEREAFLADVHMGVISIPEPGRGPLTVPVWYSCDPGGELRVLHRRSVGPAMMSPDHDADRSRGWPRARVGEIIET
jgi:hypothetical protein